MTDPCDDWSGFDETLSDEALGKPPDAALDWLRGQRFLHGLLRALHTDAGAREARVQAVLDRLGPVPRGRSPTWWLLAAATLLALLGWALFPPLRELPRADAAVARAIAALGEPVDRQFRLTVQAGGGEPSAALRNQFTLTTRPGMRWLLQGEMPYGRWLSGCDGETLWIQPSLSLFKPMSFPLAEAERMVAAMGHVLDLGYLDILALVQRLPQDCELRAVGREPGPAGLGDQLRVEAVALPDRIAALVSSATLLCDEATGMVTRIEVKTNPTGSRPRTVVLEYRGTVQLGADAYRMPR
jgi:hypothetical protein